MINTSIYNYSDNNTEVQFTGFVQTLESPGILLFRIRGLESPGKRHRSWKTLESPGILKQRFWIFLFVV